MADTIVWIACFRKRFPHPDDVNRTWYDVGDFVLVFDNTALGLIQIPRNCGFAMLPKQLLAKDTWDGTAMSVDEMMRRDILALTDLDPVSHVNYRAFHKFVHERYGANAIASINAEIAALTEQRSRVLGVVLPPLAVPR